MNDPMHNSSDLPSSQPPLPSLQTLVQAAFLTIFATGATFFGLISMAFIMSGGMPHGGGEKSGLSQVLFLGVLACGLLVPILIQNALVLLSGSGYRWDSPEMKRILITISVPSVGILIGEILGVNALLGAFPHYLAILLYLLLASIAAAYLEGVIFPRMVSVIDGHPPIQGLFAPKRILVSKLPLLIPICVFILRFGR